ncbi:LAME_0D05468g1_1 [Lachancea meyersii CBS 8951]|uniref:Conserved oligomeric Golgi complex subunit 5 n=1 Tax=Lachancea meyersii CBS 8951 TaxID=1266667 RepID=A0A1G4J8R8_9SACH|nr:LAME_0D05468g1_1 [Lachancea meyersii CBS 8951]
MSSGKHLKDFEQYLDPEFRASQACFELLKGSHIDPDSNELDLLTSIKKVRYALDEVNKRSENVIRANPLHLIDTFDNRNLARIKTRESLGPNIEYLKMSYSRLDKDVLEPYEECLQLQSALSKIHQTSSILRDVLTFLHLLKQLGNTDPSALKNETNLSDQTLLTLASAHAQIQTALFSNPNLRALRFVKKYETETLTPSRRETLKVMSESLIQTYSGEMKSQSKLESASRLLPALYELSPKDFVSVMDKILLSRINSSAQALTKTITSIKIIPTALESTVRNAQNVSLLENTLRATTIDTVSLFSEYISHKKHDSLIDMFWNRVSKAFRKDFETSFTRGGPVGKALASNSAVIMQSIRQTLNTDPVIASCGLEKMLDSVSILNKQSSK